MNSLRSLIFSATGRETEESSSSSTSGESSSTAATTEVSFSLRRLAAATLVLLVASHGLLAIQCASGRALREEAAGKQRLGEDTDRGSFPVVSEWKRSNGTKPLKIYEKLSGKKKNLSRAEGTVPPGDTLILFGVYDNKNILKDDNEDELKELQKETVVRVLSPHLGFCKSKFQNQKTGRSYMTKIRDIFDNDRCPLVYTSVFKEGSTSRYAKAPAALLVSQCLWNATQVLHLLLLVCVVVWTNNSKFMIGNEKGTEKGLHNTIGNNGVVVHYSRILAWTVLAATAILLPVSAYVISPMARWFALSTSTLVILTVYATSATAATVISANNYNNEYDRMLLSIRPTFGGGNRKTLPSFLIYEETLCALCYLGSSIYNSAAGAAYKGFPYFAKLWKRIDTVFDLRQYCNNGEDLTTLFFSPLSGGGGNNVIIPPFVPRTKSGVARNVAFSGAWTVLPFLYVLEFLIAMVLSRRSPGRRLQICLAAFGVLHFLFGTDMVSYQYGRGYKNDHEDFFHWTEKWSWRICILLPLYQNCTNGHWGKDGHRRYPIAGRAVRWFAATFGICFFLFQTLQADVPSTYAFFKGGGTSKKNGLIHRWGLYEKSTLMKKLSYPYFRALVVAWSMYLFLRVVPGFKLNRIELRPAYMSGVGNADGVAVSAKEETAGLMLEENHDGGLGCETVEKTV